MHKIFETSKLNTLPKLQMNPGATVSLFEGDGTTPILTNVQSPGFASSVTSSTSNSVVHFLGGPVFSNNECIGFKVYSGIQLKLR